jgi:hypothetical protein
MRATSPHFLPGIDYPDERASRRKVDHALYDAIAHRLERAQTRLGPSLPTDEAGERLRHRFRALIGRHGADETRVDAFYESEPVDDGGANALHALTLDIAERAENLVRDLEARRERPDLVAKVESHLEDIERMVEECVVMATGAR